MFIKKNIIKIFVVGIVSITVHSCSHTTSVEFTNATMRPWFDLNCGGCHKSGARNASDWKYDPTNYAALQKDMSEVYKEVYSKRSMPVGGMADSSLQAFKKWYDAGYPN